MPDFSLHALLSLCGRQIFGDRPIEHEIVFKGLADEKIAKEFTQVGVSRFVIKAARTNMIEISGEFLWKALAQIFRTDRLLIYQDELLLLLLILGFETLPWERTAEEVEKHIS